MDGWLEKDDCFWRVRGENLQFTIPYLLGGGENNVVQVASTLFSLALSAGDNVSLLMENHRRAFGQSRVVLAALLVFHPLYPSVHVTIYLIAMTYCTNTFSLFLYLSIL